MAEFSTESIRYVVCGLLLLILYLSGNITEATLIAVITGVLLPTTDATKRILQDAKK